MANQFLFRKRFLLRPLSEHLFEDMRSLDTLLEELGLQLLAAEFIFVQQNDEWYVGRPVAGRGRVPDPFLLQDLKLKKSEQKMAKVILFSLREELGKLSKGEGFILQVNSALDENNSFDLSFKMIEYEHTF